MTANGLDDNYLAWLESGDWRGKEHRVHKEIHHET